MMSLYMISNIEHICNEIIFHNSIYYSYFALFCHFIIAISLLREEPMPFMEGHRFFR